MGNSIVVHNYLFFAGHSFGATGALEAIFSILSIKGSKVPPTINATKPDLNCDLNLIANEYENLDITYAISNSLVFGGHNAVLLFKKYNEK